jgi:hypothetical protein
MFEQLCRRKLPENVYINPEIINKQRFHGSLTRGIVSNMKYCLSNFSFKYFIILSSRTIFYKPISVKILNKKQPTYPNVNWFNNNARKHGRKFLVNQLYRWRWPSITQSLLCKHYLNKGHSLFRSGHEGLTFHSTVCETIVQFLKTHAELRKNLYNFKNCVEEVSLQTISCNEINITKSNYYGFIDIGNGPATFNSPPNNDKHVYKIWRV